MEENKDNMEVDSVKEERDEFRPFLGLFRMTRFERILHSSILALIGATFLSYTVWTRIIPGQKTTIDINGFYILPCFILSSALLLSAFPIRPGFKFSGYLLQFLLRVMMVLLWFTVYIQTTNIISTIFYKYLPA